MSQLERRVTELEQRAGVVGLDVGALAVLDPDDADFYLAVTRRAAAHPKGGFESFVRTLNDDDVERLAAVEIRLMDDTDCRTDLVEALALRQACARA